MNRNWKITQYCENPQKYNLSRSYDAYASCNRGGVLATALCDGASEASLSHIGAVYIAEFAAQYFAEHFDQIYNAEFNEACEALITFQQAMIGHIATVAQEKKNVQILIGRTIQIKELNKFASSVQILAVKNDEAIYFKVGNGSAVIASPGGVITLSDSVLQEPPVYITNPNPVSFLINCDFKTFSLSDSCYALALATDGVEFETGLFHDHAATLYYQNLLSDLADCESDPQVELQNIANELLVDNMNAVKDNVGLSIIYRERLEEIPEAPVVAEPVLEVLEEPVEEEPEAEIVEEPIEEEIEVEIVEEPVEEEPEAELVEEPIEEEIEVEIVEEPVEEEPEAELVEEPIEEEPEVEIIEEPVEEEIEVEIVEEPVEGEPEAELVEEPVEEEPEVEIIEEPVEEEPEAELVEEPVEEEPEAELVEEPVEEEPEAELVEELVEEEPEAEIVEEPVEEEPEAELVEVPVEEEPEAEIVEEPVEESSEEETVEETEEEEVEIEIIDDGDDGDDLEIVADQTSEIKIPSKNAGEPDKVLKPVTVQSDKEKKITKTIFKLFSVSIKKK